MINKEINGHKLDIHGYEDHESIRHLVDSWTNHQNEFESIRTAVKNDSDQKLHLGDIVFEYRDGRYVVRQSSDTY